MDRTRVPVIHVGRHHTAAVIITAREEDESVKAFYLHITGAVELELTGVDLEEVACDPCRWALGVRTQHATLYHCDYTVPMPKDDFKELKEDRLSGLIKFLDAVSGSDLEHIT